MAKFHVNKETGAMGRCSAQIKCPLGGESGVENHYNTQKEAIAASEKILEQQFKSMNGLKKEEFKKEVKESVAEENPYKIVINDKFTTAPAAAISVDTYAGGRGWTGSNLAKIEAKNGNKYIPTKEYAKYIREDIKTAIKAGDLPKNMKYSVSVDNYSGGSSIKIVLSQPGAKNSDMFDYNFNDDRFEKLKPEYDTVMKRVEQISNSYTYNHGNAMVDYFNHGFYTNIRMDDDYSNSIDVTEKSKTKLNNIIAKKEKAGMSNKSIVSDQEYLDAWDEYAKNCYDRDAALYRATELSKYHQDCVNENVPNRSHESDIPVQRDKNGELTVPWDKIEQKANSLADVRYQDLLKKQEEKRNKILGFHNKD